MWTPEDSLCVPKLDLGRQLGIETINEGHAMMLVGKGEDYLQKALSRNVQQFAFDLTTDEEELMAAIGYPGLRQHCEEHEGIRRKARELMQRFQRGQTTIAVEHSLFVLKWIVPHIKTSDRSLAEYMRRHDGASALPGLFARRVRGGLSPWRPSL